MEVKAQLNKPYSDKERMDFIVEQNHNLGYEIQETEEALLAVCNEPTLEEQNDQIRQQRQARFAKESDPLYLDFMESLYREESQAEEKKQIWLAKKDEIRNDLPYYKLDK